MKLIEQSYDLWGETPSDKNDAILWIERAGRVCYRSEDKIVDGSGIKFVSNIWKRNHYSVLEHSNIVIRTKDKSIFPNMKLIEVKSIFNSKYFDFCVDNDYVYISGNWRVWIEFFLTNKSTIVSLDHMPDIVVSDGYELVNNNDVPNAVKRVTVEFITDRAVTHELVRHRPVSYSQESQRYVRYDDVFFIKPWWLNNRNSKASELFYDTCLFVEESYRQLIGNGMKAEEARAILPNATATKIVVTASIPEWKHIFNLRVSKAAYPQINNLIKPLKNQMEKEFCL